MNNIPIQLLPRQSFSTILNGSRFDIFIVETNGVMSVSIEINDIPVIQNVRATAGTFLLPYLYEENGNFMFFNINEEIIYYTNFGSSQTLVYLSPDDLNYLRGTHAG